jgi:ABC-type Fe3+ transport system substrate-binding protein
MRVFRCSGVQDPGSPHEAVARRFLAYVVSKEGQAVMKRFGFQPPLGR